LHARDICLSEIGSVEIICKIPSRMQMLGDVDQCFDSIAGMDTYIRQQKVRMKKSILRRSFFSRGSTAPARRYVIKPRFSPMTTVERKRHCVEMRDVERVSIEVRICFLQRTPNAQKKRGREEERRRGREDIYQLIDPQTTRARSLSLSLSWVPNPQTPAGEMRGTHLPVPVTLNPQPQRGFRVSIVRASSQRPLRRVPS
jgi:hypothetical protein